MERTQIYLTKEEKAQLRKLSRRSGLKQSELIRNAIDEFLVRSAPPLRRDVIQKCRGIWKDRDESELRSIRQEMERRLAP